MSGGQWGIHYHLLPAFSQPPTSMNQSNKQTKIPNNRQHQRKHFSGEKILSNFLLPELCVELVCHFNPCALPNLKFQLGNKNKADWNFFICIPLSVSWFPGGNYCNHRISHGFNLQPQVKIGQMLLRSWGTRLLAGDSSWCITRSKYTFIWTGILGYSNFISPVC